ncbi:hypothetical protein R1flu_016838 [Riccia fluitans]|uniref:Uncharacterized protein n=1 Tax=Riccia fluitans TaxID=41844 RepID=A0ABD1YRW5_9MARC
MLSLLGSSSLYVWAEGPRYARPLKTTGESHVSSSSRFRTSRQEKDLTPAANTGVWVPASKVEVGPQCKRTCQHSMKLRASKVILVARQASTPQKLQITGFDSSPFLGTTVQCLELGVAGDAPAGHRSPAAGMETGVVDTSDKRNMKHLGGVNITI